MTTNRETFTRVAYYKNIWQTITTEGAILDENNVAKVLQSAKSELLQGITIYKPYNGDSYAEWKGQHNFKDPGIHRLVQKLSISLNLHTCDVWNLLCNYLIFEYYGKIADIKKVTESPEHTKNFIESLWYFYTSERMYILKTIRYILENYDKNSNSFNVYGKYVDVLVPDIFRSLLKQLSYLIKEINSSTYTHCISKKQWIDRNNREQLEVVASVIVSMKHMNLEMNDYIQMINLFKKYDFTREPTYFEVNEIGDPDVIKNIRNAEIGACLVGLLHCWDTSDIWKPYIEHIEAAIMPLFREGDEGNYAVLALAWSTLQMTLPPEIAMQAYNKKYHIYISYAFQYLPFEQMYEISISKNFMENTVGELIRTAMYKLVQHVCDRFDSEGMVYNSKYSCRLLSEILREPKVAADCFRRVEQGATTLYNTSLRIFPFDFTSITYIYTTLATYEKYRNKVLEYLLNMPYYTEEFVEEQDHGIEELVLSRNYEAQLLDLVFPAGTKVILWNTFGKTLFTVKRICNYFVVFTYLVNDLMISATVNQKTIESICAGYELISAIFKIPETNRIREVANCSVLIAPLLLKFSQHPFKDQAIINTLFKVCTELIKSHDETILSLLLLHNFLPSYILQHYNIQYYYRKESINVGTIHEFILVDRNEHTFNLLLSYLGLIEACVENGTHLKKIQLPGIIYMTSNVFNVYADWMYSHSVDRHKIAGICLNIYFHILQKNPTNIENEIEYEIYKYCKTSFMINTSIMKAYLKIVRVSNIALNLHMHGQSDWKCKSLQIYRNVKIALTIFVIMLNDKTMYEEILVKFVFPNENERRNFLKVIAGYMQQVFDECIAELAVIILRKIAKVSRLPMLSSLDMDYYQIQGLFLYKLRDPLVSNELKIAIVEFITVCVQTQHALTAALFNIVCDYQTGVWTKQTDDASGTNESVTQFLIEYLSNIKKSPEYLHSPLQASVLNLFYHIWLNKKEILIEDLIGMDLFWPTLIDPLIRTSDLPYTAYSQIFNIISLELFKCKDNPNEELKITLENMFNKTELFITTWCTRLLSIIDECSKKLQDNSPTVLLLRDWKNFIVTTTKVYPDIYNDSEIRYCLLESTVKGLKQHFKTPGVSQVIGSWIELYLYLITIWPETCNHFTSVSIDCLISVNMSFADFHCHFKKIIRANFIGSILRTVMQAKSYFTSKPYLLYEFLEPVGQVISFEFKLLYLEENKRMRLSVKENDMTWVLLCHLISYLLNMENVEKLFDWFQQNKILTLLLDSLSLFIIHKETVHTTKAIVSCLTHFVNSPLAKCFLNITFATFYDSITVSLNDIDFEQIRTGKQNLSYYKQWWQIYRGIIEINTVLLEKFGALMLQNGFSFMSLHLNIIKETFRLPHNVADKSALKLVCSLLNYCLLLLNWKQYWHMDNHICFRHIMDGVKDCFNSSICIILRPKSICFFKLNNEAIVVPSDRISNKRIKDIMDLIIDIVTCCCKCFIKSSIRLTRFLGYYGTGQGTRMVENDFSVPKMQHTSSLTFGSLLCTLHFLCKCTTQINLYRYSPNTFEPIINPKDEGHEYAAFICLDYGIGQTALDKFNTVQHFATSEVSSMSAPWLCHLNEEKIQYGLETLATFLAEEIYITLHTKYLHSQVVPYVRRELCSELQTFHEFIRKKTIDLQAQKDILENTGEQGINIVRNKMEMNIVTYLGTLSQWFIYICDLFD